jgi:arginine decarboxylase
MENGNNFLPKQFFLTGGIGISKTSALNAFDHALAQAGIAQCNLIQISSILPRGAKEIKRKNLDPGTITFSVLSRMDGASGDYISAGVGWARCGRKRGNKISEEYGLIMEGYGNKTKKYLKEEISWKLKEMARARGLKIIKENYYIKGMAVPKDNFGSVVACLVYLPW